MSIGLNTQAFTAEQIAKAVNNGIEAGQHDSTIGNVFRSAWPAAYDYAYGDNNILRDVFTIGYLGELPHGGITTDQNGVVVAV